MPLCISDLDPTLVHTRSLQQLQGICFATLQDAVSFRMPPAYILRTRNPRFDEAHTTCVPQGGE